MMMLNVLNYTITIEKNQKNIKSLFKTMEVKRIEDELEKVKNKYLYQNFNTNRFL